MDIPAPKPDADNAGPTDNEVMAQYGKAVFEAQRFEHLLCTTAMMLTAQKGDRAPFLGEDGNSDETKVTAYVDKLERLSLGQLKGELEKLKMLDDRTIQDIVELNAERRRLVHFFFADSHDLLQTQEGRQTVVRQLDGTRSRFEDAGHVLQDVLNRHMVLSMRAKEQGL